MGGKKQFIAVIIALLALAGLFFIPYSQETKTAALIIGIIPFGGRVITRVECTCEPGTSWIIVGPPTPGSFMITPATTIFKLYLPFPPNWVLGLAKPPGIPCLTKPFCEPVGGGPIISIMGTSD